MMIISIGKMVHLGGQLCSPPPKKRDLCAAESKGCPPWRCCLWTIESTHIGQPFISWHVSYSLNMGLFSNKGILFFQFLYILCSFGFKWRWFHWKRCSCAGELSKPWVGVFLNLRSNSYRFPRFLAVLWMRCLAIFTVRSALQNVWWAGNVIHLIFL